MVAATVTLFLAMNTVNEALFQRFEFANGINWVFLPAGLRLLATLVFGGAGAIGLLIAGLLLNFYHFQFDGTGRMIAGAIAGAAGPYLVYRFGVWRYRFSASLIHLTSRRLLLLVLMCSAASPLLHHLWMLYDGHTHGWVQSYLAMFVGDLNGTLLVIYAIKLALAFLPRRT